MMKPSFAGGALTTIMPVTAAPAMKPDKPNASPIVVPQFNNPPETDPL